MHYVLLYDYVDDYLEKRKPLRSAHLAYARSAVNRGELVLGGAFADAPAEAGVDEESGERKKRNQQQHAITTSDS